MFLKIVTLGAFSLTISDLACALPHCTMVSISPRALLSHYRVIHCKDMGPGVPCPYTACNILRRFHSESAIRRHFDEIHPKNIDHLNNSMLDNQDPVSILHHQDDSRMLPHLNDSNTSYLREENGPPAIQMPRDIRNSK